MLLNSSALPAQLSEKLRTQYAGDLAGSVNADRKSLVRSRFSLYESFRIIGAVRVADCAPSFLLTFNVMSTVTGLRVSGGLSSRQITRGPDPLNEPSDAV